MIETTFPYSIAELVRDRAKEFKDSPVFSMSGDYLSYADFDLNSNRTANALLAAGIKPGDRIAFLAKNSPVYFELMAAVAKIRAVIVPINWRLAGPELVYVLNDCEANLVFCGPEFAEQVIESRASLLNQPPIYSISESTQNCDSYADFHNGFSTTDPLLDESADDDVVQLYTSGTTGNPKGAVLSSRMLLSLRGQEDDDVLASWQLYEPGETALLAMPCFHVGGTSFGFSLMYNGGHAVVIAEYDPDIALALIEKYRIQKIFMVPAALQILLNNPNIDNVDLSSLNYIFYGASPIPLELMRAAIDRFGCGFVQMYGMTETGGTIVALPPEDHSIEFNEKMRSVGKPLWGVELKIIDEQGNTLPAGVIGEIATRSDKNISKYWKLPEATAETIDEDGWLRTGDAGYIDADGYLYIHDRVKDMIISGGENVYPAEVENAIYSHESVADVAVVGVPDKLWGEAVKAFVVLKEGAELDEKMIIDFARTQIASYKCPKSVNFIETLPRNPSGKILRRELREPFWEGKTKAVN